MLGVFDDHGVRFAYPASWELEVAEEGTQTNVSAQSPDGLAFFVLRIDETRPDPTELADEALEAMRQEYPSLEAVPALETIDGHKAVGYDLEFFSLDLLIDCVIRAFRTPRRAILFFGQWSEPIDASGESPDPADLIRAVRTSLEETDAG